MGTSKQLELSFNDLSGLFTDVGVDQVDLQVRLFHAMDEDCSGTVDFKEMMSFCRLLSEGGPNEKAKFIFQACDTNGKGEIDKVELQEMLCALVLAREKIMPSYSLIKTEQDA